MIGVTAERGLVWLILGRTLRKQFGMLSDDAYALADELDAARRAAELQQLGPPLGLVYECDVKSRYGQVWLTFDRLMQKVPLSRQGAQQLADMVRFKASMAAYNLEVLING